MPTSLVIVESPAKTKKIAGFLGPNFIVLATMGHIRALDEDLDAVGIDRDFEPRYHFLKEKSKATKPILDAAARADTIYLAADDDREGEAIAYSVACLLKKDPLSLPRAVFHEITAKAVKEAIAKPRRLDMNRVMAQQARSVLDMMVGFTISPLLWKHVARALSAGRCQTPALRLVYDREKSIKDYSSQMTWALAGNFLYNSTQFLFRMNDELEDESSALNYMENIHTSDSAKVKSITVKPWTLNPPKPLITSTLQQDASALYKLNPKATMKIAQSLYEAGHITYMRTDSAVLSEEAIAAAQTYVKENYGEKFVGNITPVTQEKKEKKAKKESSAAAGGGGGSAPPAAQEAHALSSASKAGSKKEPASLGAQPQEAHEAIRPTHMEHPELPEGDWSPIDKKVYSLIWRRAVQATMAAATGKLRTVSLTLDSDPDEFAWSSSLKTTDFEGWQILGKPPKLDDSEEEDQTESSNLTKLKEGDTLKWSSIQSTPKISKASPRFTEATLIRELEHKGIGRPSTFASLIDVLFEKNYIEKVDIPGEKINQTTLLLKPTEWPPSSTVKQILVGAEKQKLIPTALGESVLGFCVKEFPQLFSYDFTAQMENRLDSIAKGEEEWKKVCRDTWSSYKDDHARLSDKSSKPSKSEKLNDFGNGFKAVMSQKGPLLVQEASSPSEKTLFYPFPKGYTVLTITEEIAKKHIESLKTETSIGVFDGQPIHKKKGPYGLYAQCGDMKIPMMEDEPLEKIVEKFKMKKETTSNNHRVGGYVFSVGQYGPYMYKEGLKTKNFLSIPDSIDPKTLTLAQAEDLYKKLSESKKSSPRGGRGGFRGRGGFKNK